MFRHLFTTTIALLPLTASAQDLPRALVPDWVTVNTIPEIDPELLPYASGGVFYRLDDTQVRHDGDRAEVYHRLSIEVLSREGLEEAANILRSYDPEFDRLSLVHLDIIRDGEVIALADEVSAELFRRETQVEQGILDGTMSVHLVAPDVRVGDVVDLAFLWESEAPVPGSLMTGRYQLEYDVPTGMSQVTSLWPSDVPISLSTLRDEVEFSHSEGEMQDRYVWTVTGQVPPEIEDELPPEFNPYLGFEYSGYADWEAVTAVLGGHYEVDHAVPEAWAADVARIAAEHKGDPAARAFAALRLVQERVRYVGVEIGAGGYYARDPALVVSQGFGDCKDKAVLLRTLLRALDVEAEVALTDLDQGWGLPDRLPSVFAFDHMIAGAKIHGEWVWMDPTSSYEEGGLVTAARPDYGYVLPVTPGRDDLVRIDPEERSYLGADVTESYRFTPRGVLLTVTSHYQNRSADGQRGYWARNSVRDIADRYLDYYRHYYPEIERLDLPTLHDQKQANRVLVVENYLIPKDSIHETDLVRDFTFVGPDYGWVMRAKDRRNRRSPLLINHPVSQHHRVLVANAPIEFAPPDRVEMENEAFSYTFWGGASEGGNMTLDWTLESHKRIVAPQDVARVMGEADEMNEMTTWSWDLTPEGAKVDAPSGFQGFVDGLMSFFPQDEDGGQDR